MVQTRTTAPRFDSVEAFESWERSQQGAWELHAGEAVAMAPERVGHTRIKANAWLALDRAVQDGRPGACEALADGVTVRVGDDRRFQPDALVTFGDRVADDRHEADAPVVIVEVLSPSTQHVDVSLKLGSYFELATVQHYLVVSSAERLVVHHRRTEGPSLLTSLHRAGPIVLDPPGLRILVDDLYRGTALA